MTAYQHTGNVGKIGHLRSSASLRGLKQQMRILPGSNQAKLMSKLREFIYWCIATCILTGCANSSLPRPPVTGLAAPEQWPLYRLDIGDVLDVLTGKKTKTRARAKTKAMAKSQAAGRVGRRSTDRPYY